MGGMGKSPAPQPFVSGQATLTPFFTTLTPLLSRVRGGLPGRALVDGDMYSLKALLGSYVYSVGGDQQFPTFRYLLNPAKTFLSSPAIENAT